MFFGLYFTRRSRRHRFISISRVRTFEFESVEYIGRFLPNRSQCSQCVPPLVFLCIPESKPAVASSVVSTLLEYSTKPVTLLRFFFLPRSPPLPSQSFDSPYMGICRASEISRNRFVVSITHDQLTGHHGIRNKIEINFSNLFCKCSRSLGMWLA